jgi:hypothetical protein
MFSRDKEERMRHVYLWFFIIALVGCSKPAKPAEPKPGTPRLTAVEQFHLQGECANLAQKLAQKHAAFLRGVGFVPLDQTSHYSPRDNRCYVQTTTPDDLNRQLTITMLWDGQTEELLAYVEPSNAPGDHRRLVGFIFGSPANDEVDAVCAHGHPDTEACADATMNQSFDFMNDKMNH